MSNPLYNELNKQQNNDLMSKFARFKAQFKGDPKEMVQQLLNSGQMTQEQFNILSSMAQNFMKTGGK